MSAPASTEPLHADAIRAQLSAPNAAMLEHIEVLAAVDSTNSWLLRTGGTGARACFAEQQTAGRGRRQRPWISPRASNLYFSVGYALAPPQPALATLSLAIGVAVAEQLHALGAGAVGLKWPNDVFIDDAKLGGILTEVGATSAARIRVVVGIGLNVSMTSTQAAGVSQPWTRLADHVRILPARNVLAGRLLEAVLAALQAFQEHGFAAFQTRWQRFDILHERPVQVTDGQRLRSGVARGIAADGALQVAFGPTVEAVYAGEVSLRIAP
ncbi:MAG TPA: biotin--[acetyl-CoA-carboxylase] ligase [Salinisphaeraceae bacterium]|nr:biotin--[acetyl-CoA-carboxylase] ligase [Salinisphaeraceae bacterium]